MAQISPADTPEVEVIVSNRTIFRIIAAVILAILFFAAVRRSGHTLTLIGAALFLSLALNAPVHWLADHLPGRVKGNRGFATGFSIVVVLLLLAGFLWLIVPPLASQTTKFVQQAPALIEQARDQNSSFGKFVQQHNLQGQVDKLSDQVSRRANNIGGTAFTTITHIGSSLFAVLTVTVLTVMMLAEGPRWRRIFEQLMPVRHAPRVQRLAHDMNRVIRGYVNGQVTLAAIAAVLIVPMLFIFHVSNPLALMVIIFICGLIPMVGHTIGAIIVTTVALFHSLTAGIFVLAYYILYQQIENYVVQPRIQANATNMSALLVFLSVILGANFGGLLGALVAIPVVGCIRVAVLDYLESRKLLSPAAVKREETQKRAI
ncbi:MAG TPA: AI-2E family transporter [Candidatus Saccharimonadales bacterium]|nr:AI-2E family transporter [Candidatus Saccharimonadales bacterium]